MAITIVLELTGLAAGLTVPMVLVQAGIMLIVWQSVLGFTRESLRAIRRILPGALALIMVLNIAAAGLGVVLAHVAGLSMLDGYLRRAPAVFTRCWDRGGVGIQRDVCDGIPSRSDVLMLFAAPFVARVFLRFTPQSAETASASGALVPVAA